MENQEKTEVEVKERKGWMGPETKTALIATGLSLLSVVCLYLTAYSNQITEPGGILGGITGGIFGGITGGIAGGIAGGFVAGIVAGFVAGILGGIFLGGIAGGFVAGIVAGFVAGILGGIFLGGITGGIFGSIAGGFDDKTDIKEKILPMFLLIIVFLLPFCSLIVPLSKYNNKNCIERDKRIAEILEVTLQKDSVKIVLPSNHVKEHNYLKNVLSIFWEEEKSWQKIAIPCQKGSEHWFEVMLPLLENKAKIKLLFNHAWNDLEIEKDISGLKQ